MINSKAAKKLRKFIRDMFPSIPARGLDTPTRTVLVPAYELGLKQDGTPHMRPMEYPLPARNVKSTHRGYYRQMKKVLPRAVA
jgi:hypothetical protein